MTDQIDIAKLRAAYAASGLADCGPLTVGNYTMVTNPPSTDVRDITIDMLWPATLTVAIMGGADTGWEDTQAALRRAEYLVEAANTAPSLCDLVERQAAEIQRLREALCDIHDTVSDSGYPNHNYILRVCAAALNGEQP